MNRIFTFGCSFTQYWRWPTWADAIGHQAEFYENWGMCGGGNSLIFYSLVECHRRQCLGPGDTVYVMWTNTSREDRYVRGKWLTAGNVYWTDGTGLPREYLLNFTCERGYLIRDLATIAAAKDLLSHWGCQYRFFSMVPLHQTNQSIGLGENPEDEFTDDTDVLELYQSVLENIAPSVYETVFDHDWNSRPGITDSYDARRRDFHPTPCEHLLYLDKVAPDINISDATRHWMADWEQCAANGKTWHSLNLPSRRF